MSQRLSFSFHGDIYLQHIHQTSGWHPRAAIWRLPAGGTTHPGVGGVDPAEVGGNRGRHGSLVGTRDARTGSADIRSDGLDNWDAPPPGAVAESHRAEVAARLIEHDAVRSREVASSKWHGTR